MTQTSFAQQTKILEGPTYTRGHSVSCYCCYRVWLLCWQHVQRGCFPVFIVAPGLSSCVLPVCCTKFSFSLPLSSSIYQGERQPPNPHSWVWNSPCTLTTHTRLILDEGPTSNSHPCVLCGYENTACNQPLCEAEWVSGCESSPMPTSATWVWAEITAVTDPEGWQGALVSSSIADNVFHLILRDCKNSLNCSSRRAVPWLGVCRYLCPFTSPTQYATPSSSSSHGMGRAGKTSLPPHCAQSVPSLVILWNEALLQDSAVHCASLLSFIHFLTQPLAKTAWGAPIQPQRTEPARAGKGAGTALTRYYRHFHSSSPQSMFILTLCDYLVNPGQRGSPSGKQKLHGVKASVQTVPG